jgi:hypothetical protein
MLLFLSRFSIRTRFATKKYCGLDYAIGLPVDGVKSHFNYSHLLYHDFRPAFEFRDYDTKFLSSKNTDIKL